MLIVYQYLPHNPGDRVSAALQPTDRKCNTIWFRYYFVVGSNLQNVWKGPAFHPGYLSLRRVVVPAWQGPVDLLTVCGELTNLINLQFHALWRTCFLIVLCQYKRVPGVICRSAPAPQWVLEHCRGSVVVIWTIWIHFVRPTTLHPNHGALQIRSCSTYTIMLLVHYLFPTRFFEFVWWCSYGL